MTRLWWRRAAMLTLAAAALAALWLAGRAPAPQPAPTRLALLIPDELPLDDVHVQAWQDAAAELGFELAPLRASALLRAGHDPDDAALIVPDTVHRRMNDALVAALEQRVRAGARLMLVYDAGVLGMEGDYHPVQSRLSRLAGVSYARYGALGPHMAAEREAWVDGAALALLRLPPGKLMRADSEEPLTSSQPAPRPGEAFAVVGYHYGRLRYPAFETDGGFEGQQLMHGQDGTLLAGRQALGRGEVLFVNLPLSWLKLRTDGLLLHSLLRHFALDVAQLPRLAPTPEARGALIMNWHVDAAAAVPAIDTLGALGAFSQGPYSIHLTAGPDLDAFGDGRGMGLASNARMRAWVERFAGRGDEVGSHGGWAHNLFGRMVDQQPPERSIPMIQANLQAVQAASGRPVREYSAPLGNHPAWVTPWLREHGIHAYYFTGDIGMAPTRSYQDGRRGPSDMWAFPVMSYGEHASFEEGRMADVPQRDVEAWLRDLADFCVEERTVRLVYFHPPGIALFPQAFAGWMRHTGELVRAGRLRWITMARYADFANARLEVRWQTRADPQRPGTEVLQASHPQSLDSFAWLLPVARYERPSVLEGQAEITRDGDAWRVLAGPAARLRLGLPLRVPGPSTDFSSTDLSAP